MTAAGAASWADFATAIFEASARHGGPTAEIARTPSSAYPMPARRPANSRLDCGKLERAHGVQLGDWNRQPAKRSRVL